MRAEIKGKILSSVCIHYTFRYLGERFAIAKIDYIKGKCVNILSSDTDNPKRCFQLHRDYQTQNFGILKSLALPNTFRYT